MLSFEKLKDLKWYVEDEVYTQDVRADILVLLDEAIACQYETEKVICPYCNGSGVYQEYDEYDRYYVHTCGTCEGTGDVDRNKKARIE